MPVLTLEGLIAVMSLIIGAFGLGYAVGHDMNTKK